MAKQAGRKAGKKAGRQTGRQAGCGHTQRHGRRIMCIKLLKRKMANRRKKFPYDSSND